MSRTTRRRGSPCNVTGTHKGGYTLEILPRTITPYRDRVDGNRDHVTYQQLIKIVDVHPVVRYVIKSWLRGNVTGMFGALTVLGRRIKGMMRLRPEQVYTCNVTRHHRPLLSLLYIHGASASRNKLGTPWCNARRILLRREARDESSDRNFVSCLSFATLWRYGTR
jgi:hypothetical protein